MNAPNAPQTTAAGSFGATQRPKNRFIDRVLMHNRDQKSQQAQLELAAEQGSLGTGSPNPMSPTPGMAPEIGDAGQQPGMAQALMKILGRG